MAGNRYSEEIKEEARELRNQGWSYKQIADKFGTSKSMTHYWCNNINYSSNSKAQLDHLIENIIVDPLYDIREDGTIWTLKDKTGKLVTNTWRQCDKKRDQNYKAVKYSGKNLRVHRIVYRKFKGKLDPNLEINHIDGNKHNNTPENLELLTSQENIQHSVDNKLHCFGEKVGTSVLTEDIVKTIRQLFYHHNLSKSEIQKKLNLKKTTVHDICEFNSWKHVTDF
jgi:transcriptional regulator with XRE-family HTH domain